MICSLRVELCFFRFFFLLFRNHFFFSLENYLFLALCFLYLFCMGNTASIIFLTCLYSQLFRSLRIFQNIIDLIQDVRYNMRH